MADDHGATVRAWTDLVRRARLGRTVKCVAAILATYADADGTRIFPGLARLAIDCELTYKVVKNAVATLRQVGLIELVHQANRRGRADEYRLIIGPNILDHVDVPTPAAHELAAERVRDANRRKTPAPPPPDPDTGTDMDPADRSPSAAAVRGTANPVLAVDNSPVRGTRYPVPEPAPNGCTGYGVPPTEACTGYGDAAVRGTAYPPTSQYQVTTTTSPSNGDGEDQLTAVPRAGPDQDHEVVVEEPEPPTAQPAKCPHGLPNRQLPDGRPACQFCRLGLPALGAVTRQPPPHRTKPLGQRTTPAWDELLARTTGPDWPAEEGTA